VINGKIVEQMNTFRHLGMDISYKGEVDIENQLYKFMKLTGILNRTMPVNKVRKETRVKVYNTLAVPTLNHERMLEQDLVRDPIKFWRYIKNKREATDTAYMKTYESQKYDKPEEIANTFATFFSSTYVPGSIEAKLQDSIWGKEGICLVRLCRLLKVMWIRPSGK